MAQLLILPSHGESHGRSLFMEEPPEFQREFDDPQHLSPATWAGQSVMGLALGLGLGYAGGQIGANMATCGEEEWLCGVSEGILGAGIGYALGTSLGVWGVGKSAGGKGSFTNTLLGTVVGTAFGIGAVISGVADNNAMAIALLLGLPNAAALTTYHISQGNAQTRMEFQETPTPIPGNRTRALRVRTDFVLARW